ncbi:MAG: glutaminyl-peptide cyclotransferase [Xanthomonadaceae bacterium]|nr:glutaminyl-peptide cyclotransferase [Xanthomonadaceae bacterium]
MRAFRAILVTLAALCAALPLHAVPVYPVEVVQRHPHDRAAFTQGLVWHDSRLYESTGLYGRSTLREVELHSGRVLRSAPLDRREFGEDVTVFGGVLYQLTWLNARGYSYNPDTLARTGRFRYPGEGWGLTHDGCLLITSNGSSVLRFLDPATKSVVRTVEVTLDGRPLDLLNALQYIDGKVYANVWQTTRIAEIDPDSGEVTALIELAPLLEQLGFEPDLAVESPNGIAFDPDGRRLFVTGKLWPWLFEVKVERDGARWP